MNKIKFMNTSCRQFPSLTVIPQSILRITQSIQNNIIYTTVCSMQQIYYIHNVVQMQLYVFIEYLFIFIINLLHTTQGCVYNTGEV